MTSRVQLEPETPTFAEAEALSSGCSCLAPNRDNIVLFHGFWADGSGWSKVIPALQAQGHFVIAGQACDASLADDVAATRHMLAEL